jgi:GH25 family lysozyme M1 (1,4-beta-N-acetylmuramidase)
MKAPENFPWSRMGSIAAGAVLAAAFAYAPVTANAEEAASKALAGQGQETQVVATESVAQASPSGQAVGSEGAAADSDGTTDDQSTSTEPSDQETAEFAADAAEVDGSATGATESEISSTADATASNGNDAASTAGGSSDEAKSSGTSAAEATTGGVDGETGASDVGTSTADGDASNAGASSSLTVTDGTASDTPAADAGTASDETATDFSDAAGGSTATTAPAARVAADDTSNLQNMYRFYNPNTGEHFYTANTHEGQALVTAGWQYEGVGWVALKSGTAVYRLYNPNAGDHHYTTNAAERDMLVALGWRYEGIGWYSATKSAGVSVYREYNPNAKSGAHNFTTSSAENANLVKAGWRYEGIAWYASTHASLAFDKSLFQVILNGIDIASYQGDMDISKVTADFVIVKATQGTHYKNPSFSTQAEATLSSGKKLGVYHFIDVSSGDGSMVQQAQYFVNAVKSYIGQAVLVLDWENTPGSEALRKGPSYAKQFLDEVYRLTGVRALIYMSQGVTSTYDWSSVAASGYKLWVASYPKDYRNRTGYIPNPTPISTNYGAWSSPTIWQYSDSIKVGGYSNGVDVDAFYGTTAYWDSLARKS